MTIIVGEYASFSCKYERLNLGEDEYDAVYTVYIDISLNIRV